MNDQLIMYWGIFHPKKKKMISRRLIIIEINMNYRCVAQKLSFDVIMDFPTLCLGFPNNFLQLQFAFSQKCKFFYSYKVVSMFNHHLKILAIQSLTKVAYNI